MKSNSVRVPGKNIRPFCGEPLFYKIAAELEKCSFIQTVLIDTDSEEIAKLAQNRFSKVEIATRPKHLIGEDVPMNSIIDYDLSLKADNYILQTHATSPLLRAETLEAAWHHFQDNIKNKRESLFSVTKHKARFFDSQLKPINHNPEELIKTQDLPAIFEENSSFYFFTRSSFNKNKRRIGESFDVFELDKLEALDIDTEIDFKFAEMAFNFRMS